MELTLPYILSQVFIIINYALLAISYYCKDRKTVLVISFMAVIANGLSYVFLNAYSGLAMCILALIRNIIFLIDEKKNGKSDKIYKKDIIILIILTGCNTNNKIRLEYADKIDLKLTSEKGLIEIQLDYDEAKIFVDNINKLEVEKISKQNIKGWSLYARGFDKNNKELFKISFLNSLVNINNDWYQTNQDSIIKITDNYK